MFDKTFFKFALGFTMIIAASIITLFFAGYLNQKVGSSQAASVGELR